MLNLSYWLQVQFSIPWSTDLPTSFHHWAKTKIIFILGTWDCVAKSPFALFPTVFSDPLISQFPWDCGLFFVFSKKRTLFKHIPSLLCFLLVDKISSHKPTHLGNFKPLYASSPPWSWVSLGDSLGLGIKIHLFIIDTSDIDCFLHNSQVSGWVAQITM